MYLYSTYTALPICHLINQLGNAGVRGSKWEKRDFGGDYLADIVDEKLFSAHCMWVCHGPDHNFRKAES